tara:strand:+ start:1757 stop:2164 length:408 start_codon:yes stop_codon:yes gene_type:complete
MNKHFIAGNVGKEPEIKRLDSGMTIANFTIAVNEYKKNKETGQTEQSTTWFNIVAFNQKAELVDKFVEKGKKLLIVGRVSIREYFNDAGEKRYFFETIADEIEFLSSKNDNSNNNNQTVENKEVQAVEHDDDLPF